MKEQFNFENILRKKLETYQPAAPAGAWEAISSQVGTSSAVASSGMVSSTIVKAMVGLGISAAVVAVGIAGFNSVNDGPNLPKNNFTPVVVAENGDNDKGQPKDSTQTNQPGAVNKETGDDDDTTGDDHLFGDNGQDSVVLGSDSIIQITGGPGSRKKSDKDEEEDEGDDLTSTSSTTNSGSMVDNSTTIEVKINSNVEEGFAPLVVDLSVDNSFDRVKWNINELGFESMKKNTQVTIEEPGEYLINVIVQDKYGNVQTNVKWINVLPKEVTAEVNPADNYEINLSEAFTPNADGTNDTYGISSYDVENITNLKMVIYDLNGIVQFETQDPTERWDGTTTYGELAQEGVYLVVVQYANKDGIPQKPVKGSIYLAR